MTGPGLEEATVEAAGDAGPYHLRVHAYAFEREVRSACIDHVPERLQAGRVERTDLTFELGALPIDCTALGPAECPAHPECNLFGGDGRPYACHRALAGCERLGEVACAADTTCVWRPGEASAPGGCRQACYTAEYGWGCAFDELRFCQALDGADEACGPGVPGFCQRRPPEAECRDEPDTPVCGCTPDQPTWVVVDACVRAHLRYGYVETATVCGP